MSNSDDRMTTSEAAKYIWGEKGKGGTLEQWRYRKIGPRYIKLGKNVRYEKEALDEWIAAQSDKAGGNSTCIAPDLTPEITNPSIVIPLTTGRTCSFELTEAKEIYVALRGLFQ